MTVTRGQKAAYQNVIFEYLILLVIHIESSLWEERTNLPIAMSRFGVLVTYDAAVIIVVAVAVAEPYYKSVHALALVYVKFASHTCCNTLESCHTHSLHSVQLILIANLATHIHSCKIGSGHLSDQ